MKLARLVLLALMSATLITTACGKKGSPTRPGGEPKQEKKLDE